MSSPVKVAFNTQVLQARAPGGWQRYAQEIFQRLQNDPRIELIEVFNSRRVNHSLWEQYYLPRQLHELKIQVYHSPVHDGLSPLIQCPQIMTVHDLFSEEDFSWRKAFTGIQNFKSALRYKWGWNSSLSAADAFFAVSEFTKQSLVQRGVAESRIFVTYQAANLPLPQKPSFFPREEKYFLYVGANSPRKRVSDLIHTFLQAESSRRLILIGPGCKALAKPGKVEAFENISDAELAYFYKNAEAFVSFSDREGFGLPFLESISQGTPVLYRAEGAAREVVGNAGVHLKNDSDLLDFLKNPELLKSAQENCKSQAEKFSWEKTVNQTVDVYLSLANRSKIS